MKNIIFGLSAVLSFLCFSVGLLILIYINPQVLTEIDNLAFSSFNLEGMKGQLWANSILYIGAGIFTLIALTGLLIQNQKSVLLIIGLGFLIISAIIWVTFGLVSKGLEDLEGDGNLVILRTFFFILASVIGLLLTSTENLRMDNAKTLKWITLTTAIVCGMIGVLSIFVFNDDSWIRTNLSITLIFTWVGIVGIFLMKNNKNR